MTLHSVVDPATEDVVAEVESLDVAQVDAAVARAVAAGPAWRAVAPADRARLLRRFAAAVDAHVDELADLEVRGAGHTIGNARWEAGNVRDVLDYYAAAPERLFGRQIPVAGGLDVTFREPLGVVGIIVPWNFPMPIAGWGFAPALAAGNTVVLKPAELTPLTALRLAELALEAGLPDGRVHGAAGQGLGGRASGWSTTRAGPQDRLHRLDRGRDRDHAAGAPTRSSGSRSSSAGRSRTSCSPTRTSRRPRRPPRAGVFDNAGQDCCARSRILVQRPVVRPVPGAARAGGHAACGWRTPAPDDAEMGPLIRAEQRGAGPRLRRAARTPTGRWTSRSAARRPTGPGFWYPPTVVLPRSTDDPVWREEVFGPVVAVLPFDDEADAVAHGQRHRVRPVRLDLDPRRRPRAAGGARASRAATCR